MNTCVLCGFPFETPGPEPAAPACRGLWRCPNCDYESTHTDASKSVQRAIPLTVWPLREEAVVSHLHSSDPQIHRRLIAMGLLPSSRIVVERRSPSFVFRIGCSRFAADEELLSAVYVRKAPGQETG